MQSPLVLAVAIARVWPDRSTRAVSGRAIGTELEKLPTLLTAKVWLAPLRSTTTIWAPATPVAKQREGSWAVA